MASINNSSDLLINEEFPQSSSATSSYTLHFTGDTPLVFDDQTLISVDSTEQVSLLLQLLGKTCRLHVSQEFCFTRPDISNKLEQLRSTGLSATPPFSTAIAANILKTLPLDVKRLMSSPLVLNEAQETPLIIDKNLVHKKSEKNVLISSPFTTGWIHHFNMFCDTTELIFDHDSEHIQGLLISEALRQTGIACAHIQGLPPEGKLVLLNFNTNFFNFVERKSPIIMRAYCDFHPCDSGSDKNISFYIQVLQWGRICVDSSITTFACMNTFRQQQLNNRLIKIAARQKTHFDAKIFNHLKTNSES